ncbi:MAG: radical SAM protein [Candidatus Daviesbacteria bacterium]|nr:radical SAM protein [Candidatus Daviesbacteria bacterium]
MSIKKEALRTNQTCPEYTLRLVVDKECPFDCIYCFQEGTNYSKSSSHENPDFLSLVDKFAAVRPISKIRLTGGEPLIYAPLLPLLKGLKRKFPSLDLGITTNGSTPRILQNVIEEFTDTPLHMNISIPSLNEEMFKKLTNTARLPEVLSSVNQLRESSFSSHANINFIFLEGVNDLELPEMSAFARVNNLPLKVMQLTVNEFNSDALRRLNTGSANQRLITERIQDLGYLPSQHPDSFIKDGHIIRVIGQVAPQTDQYFRDYKTFRLYYDGRIGICGDNDGIIRPINMDNPRQTFLEVVTEAEKFL